MLTFLIFCAIMQLRRGKSTMIEREINAMVQRLPLYLKKEVLDYVEFLSTKYQRKPESKKKFKFDWEGGLADVRDKMTSTGITEKDIEDAINWARNKD